MDDPRLSNLIKQAKHGDIVIVGSPFDQARKRCIHKGGEDNGPDCLRRFYKKVGPLINPQYEIDISNLSVTDYGNIYAQHPTCPQKVVPKITDCIFQLIKNNQIPFVFGGSKQSMLGSIQGFYKNYECTDKNQVIIIAGRPNVKRLYDNDKLTSQNIITKLVHDIPNIKLTLFGPQDRYFPNQNIDYSQQFRHISISQIREYNKDEKKVLGRTTQGRMVFQGLIKEGNNYHLSLSVDSIQRFAGCRDFTTSGLTFQEVLEIMYFSGQRPQIKSIDINEFNPSCEDYQSSLKLLNMLYYYLMGKTKC